MTDFIHGLDSAQIELYTTMAMLLGVCFVIGVVAVMAGVGGGVLFVPLVSAFFSIHVDYVRGAGLLVALVGAIAAAPHLLKMGLSEPRVSVPLALAGSIGSVVGARLGLAVPTEVILLILGVFMILVAIQTGLVAFRERRVHDPSPNTTDERRYPEPETSDRSMRLEDALGLSGIYRDPRSGQETPWKARRIAFAAVLFVGIGVVGGMLGVGAGWANVPVLASVLTLPLKMAAATSGLIIIANSSAAAWVYIAKGAVRPMIVLPALVGIIGGTRIGARLLGHVQPQVVRLLVIVVLSLAGIRTLIGALL